VISPNADRDPVAVTTASAVPLTTEVPRKTIFDAFADLEGPSAVAVFSAGADSPVSEAC
jgi:hypothetical protein